MVPADPAGVVLQMLYIVADPDEAERRRRCRSAPGGPVRRPLRGGPRHAGPAAAAPRPAPRLFRPLPDRPPHGPGRLRRGTGGRSRHQPLRLAPSRDESGPGLPGCPGGAGLERGDSRGLRALCPVAGRAECVHGRADLRRRGIDRRAGGGAAHRARGRHHDGRPELAGRWPRQNRGNLPRRPRPSHAKRRPSPARGSEGLSRLARPSRRPGERAAAHRAAQQHDHARAAQFPGGRGGAVRHHRLVDRPRLPGRRRHHRLRAGRYSRRALGHRRQDRHRRGPRPRCRPAQRGRRDRDPDRARRGRPRAGARQQPHAPARPPGRRHATAGQGEPLPARRRGPPGRGGPDRRRLQSNGGGSPGDDGLPRLREQYPRLDDRCRDRGATARRGPPPTTGAMRW